ncbi:hypothetical protein GE09DRAFT_1281867 [Coniochaeta sp. 2T2.1]|nr:hypothetical protein GE09DRAFT_1281867 [Coniochaeta sp. 2T2.1]
MHFSARLPPEILHEIIESLCLHCGQPAAEEWRYVDEHRWGHEEDRRVSALASLCLTSKAMSDIATRHLYHCPPPEKWSLLARTLITSPDKAEHVRDLRCGQFDWPKDEVLIPDEVRAYYQERVEAYTPVVDADGDFDRERFFRDYNLAAEVHGEGWKYYNDIVALDIVASLCPDVERLEATLGYFDTFFFCAPNSMTALKHVDFRHYDTENGVHLTNIAALFRAAPNITSMRLYALAMENSGDDDDDDGDGEPIEDLKFTLRHVKTIDTEHSAVGAGALGAILRACPSLKALNYSAGGPCVGFCQFTARQAKNMILQHAKNLESFQLDMRDDVWRDDEDDGGLDDAKEGLASRGIQFSYV